jgi:hypothetical protein
MARQVGCSQDLISLLERNRLPNVGLLTLSTIASILGLEPSLTFHAVGRALRDKGHEALIGRLLKVISPAWHAMREAPFPNPGDPRSWDVLLRLESYLVGIEAETRIRDLQALVRRMRDRARGGGTDVILIVLSDSAHNRELVDQFRAALGDEFSSSPRHLLAGLREGRPLPGSGVILL